MSKRSASYFYISKSLIEIEINTKYQINHQMDYDLKKKIVDIHKNGITITQDELVLNEIETRMEVVEISSRKIESQEWINNLVKSNRSHLVLEFVLQKIKIREISRRE